MTGSAPRQTPAYCYRCGHLWTPKADKPPKRCPRCHSSRWDVPERKVRRCKFCGMEFEMGSLDVPCPSCGRLQQEALTNASLHCNQCDYEWIRRGSDNPKRCPMCRSADWNLPKADRLMCQQCGHVWRKQTECPAKCPHCQSKNWDQPLRAVRCQRCGHVWKMRTPRSDGASPVCPKCKTKKWNEPMLVSRDSRKGTVKYTCVNTRPSKELMICRGCGHRWYMRGDSTPYCPRCGMTAGFRDRIAPTSMLLWSEGRRELTYVAENGYGCVYLWMDDVPIACRYIHEVLGDLAMTIGDVVRHVNNGDLVQRFSDLASEMESSRYDYEQYIEYFMKRLSLSRQDARVLAIHFTGMSPGAIALCLSCSEEEIDAAFDRIMAAYTDSGIIVDDTIFTEDPFRYY